MLTRRELNKSNHLKKAKKMGRCSHLSNCLQEKNPERENWVADDLFSDSVDSIIVIFILFLPFLWCSVKLSSLSVLFHFLTITIKKTEEVLFFYSTKSVALYFLPLLLNFFGSQFCFVFPLFLLLLVFCLFLRLWFLQLIMVLHAKYCMRCTIEDYL